MDLPGAVPSRLARAVGGAGLCHPIRPNKRKEMLGQRRAQTTRYRGTPCCVHTMRSYKERTIWLAELSTVHSNTREWTLTRSAEPLHHERLDQRRLPLALGGLYPRWGRRFSPRQIRQSLGGAVLWDNEAPPARTTHATAPPAPSSRNTVRRVFFRYCSKPVIMARVLCLIFISDTLP
jgi:hypothetical protein